LIAYPHLVDRAKKDRGIVDPALDARQSTAD
jgi:hypothetical protein